MNIKIIDSPSSLTFDDLKVGDYFIWGGGCSTAQKALTQCMASGIKITSTAWFSLSDREMRKILTSDKDNVFKLRPMEIVFSEKD